MISVNEAREIIKSNSKPLAPIKVSIGEAAGLVLAEDIYATIDIPAFQQSAMDGYAFCFDDYQSENKLQIIGEVPAGVDIIFNDVKQKAVRIFTGAPVPVETDTVVMQEKVVVEDGHLLINDDQLIKGSNVRPKGSEISAGELALKSGTYLSPAAVGFLAGIGVYELEVFPKPRITILVTGKELQLPGKPLQPGQVYESNSLTLKAALQQLQINSVNVILVDDDVDVLKGRLEEALKQSEMVFLTGGVSVGDYDFVIQATKLCGVDQLFHKIKQKPGKPLYFGKRENKLVFGLPGNPSSVLTCFYEYVIPAIEQITCTGKSIRTHSVPLAKDISKKTGLTHFLKGRLIDNKAMPLGAQDSYRLSSFATADCLIVLDEGGSDYKEGEVVEVHILPK